jgi:hypothetical protein
MFLDNDVVAKSEPLAGALSNLLGCKEGLEDARADE